MSVTHLVPRAPANPTPAAISAVTLNPTSAQISLVRASLEPVFGVAYYLLQQLVAGVWNTMETVLPGQFPATISGLTPSLQYSFRAIAIGAGATRDGSTTSNVVTVTMPASGSGGGAPDTTPPTVPGQPVLSSVTSTTATFSWPASVDQVVQGQVTAGLAGYLVFQGATQLTLTPITATSYTATGLSSSTQYSFTVKAVDLASPPNLSAASPALIVSTLASAPPGSLLAFMQGLNSSSPPYIMSGQDTYPYGIPSATSAWSSFTSGSTSAANANINGYVPSIIGIYVQGPANGGSGTQASVSVSGIPLVVELANSWGALGGIAQVQCFLNNPAGTFALDTSGQDGGGIMTPAFSSGNNCLTPGTTANNNLNTNLANIYALLTQINYPFIFRPIHEANGSWYWWAWGGAASGTSAAQFGALWDYIYNRFVFLGGLPNAVWAYNINGGSGGYLDGYNFITPGHVDLATWDVYYDSPGTGAVNDGTYAALVSTGLPIGICELGNGNSSSGADGTSYETMLADIKAHTPKVVWIRTSCQTWAIALNSAATAYMTDPAIITRPKLPAVL